MKKNTHGPLAEPQHRAPGVELLGIKGQTFTLWSKEHVKQEVSKLQTLVKFVKRSLLTKYTCGITA